MYYFILIFTYIKLSSSASHVLNFVYIHVRIANAGWSKDGANADIFPTLLKSASISIVGTLLRAEAVYGVLHAGTLEHRKCTNHLNPKNILKSIIKIYLT